VHERTASEDVQVNIDPGKSMRRIAHTDATCDKAHSVGPRNIWNLRAQGRLARYLSERGERLTDEPTAIQSTHSTSASLLVEMTARSITWTFP